MPNLFHVKHENVDHWLNFSKECRVGNEVQEDNFRRLLCQFRSVDQFAFRKLFIETICQIQSAIKVNLNRLIEEIERQKLRVPGNYGPQTAAKYLDDITQIWQPLDNQNIFVWCDREQTRLKYYFQSDNSRGFYFNRDMIKVFHSCNVIGINEIDILEFARREFIFRETVSDIIPIILLAREAGIPCDLDNYSLLRI